MVPELSNNILNHLIFTDAISIGKNISLKIKGNKLQYTETHKQKLKYKSNKIA